MSARFMVVIMVILHLQHISIGGFTMFQIKMIVEMRLQSIIECIPSPYALLFLWSWKTKFDIMFYGGEFFMVMISQIFLFFSGALRVPLSISPVFYAL